MALPGIALRILERTSVQDWLTKDRWATSVPSLFMIVEGASASPNGQQECRAWLQVPGRAESSGS